MVGINHALVIEPSADIVTGGGDTARTPSLMTVTLGVDVAAVVFDADVAGDDTALVDDDDDMDANGNGNGNDGTS